MLQSLEGSPGCHSLPGTACWQPAIATSGLQLAGICPMHSAAAACSDVEQAEAADHLRPVSRDSCRPKSAAERSTCAGCSSGKPWASTATWLALPLCTCSATCFHQHEVDGSAPYLHCCCAAMRPGSSTTSSLSAWPMLVAQARSRSR